MLLQVEPPSAQPLLLLLLLLRGYMVPRLTPLVEWYLCFCGFLMPFL
jgi:hypothetical protein